jgi:hypothetical protein
MNPPKFSEVRTAAAASNIILDVNSISWLSGQQACLQSMEGSISGQAITMWIQNHYKTLKIT